MNMHRPFVFIGLLLSSLLASAQAPLAATTDPARAEVVLPEPARPKLPSLFFIGDSTVRNGHDDGQGLGALGQWGWGSPVAASFDLNRINVVNRAVGGLSSRTYITSGHWQRTLALIKRGDTVLIQFGHNDASAINDTSRARGTIKGFGSESESIVNLLTGKPETVYSYGAYLRRYVTEIRAAGATPILCSLVPRKRWDEQGKISRSASSYAGWAAEIARQEGVGFIDLNELVAQRYDALGREAVMSLFPQVTPDESTHTNLAGATLSAHVVVAGLKRLKALPPEVYVDERPVVDAARVAKESPRDKRLPTLFIVGDSTVKSGGQNGAIGWGERIAPYFDTQRINVVNHAIGGRSSRTFFTEGRWDAVLAQMKAGDFVLIQFGHNDGGRIGDPAMKGRASGPGVGPEVVDDIKPDGSRESVHSFGWYMGRYIADARAKGATVVILSPIPHKDRWASGRDFETFAAWGAQVARDGGAQFIDLTLLITEAYRAAGEDAVQGFFSDARTHTNDAGARFNAARVIEGLKQLPGQPLQPFLAPLAAAFTKGRLIFADDFSQGLDPRSWLAEIAPLPDSAVYARDGRLVLDTRGGVTVWLRQKLRGDVLIEYRRKVLMQGAANDRLSDLNQFWMASDPNHADGLPFGRDGVFESYDGLSLYYVGIGGNGNTSSRLRKYEGDGQRSLLQEHGDGPHLLQANHEYLIQTLVKAGRSVFYVDGQPWFSFADPRPLTEGYFGLRSTQSHQEISGLRVYELR